jgi:biopolymer transport protein TolR
MALSTGGSAGGPRSEINVTPLVDVVLVLLIIFMVVTPMMSRGKSVALPLGSYESEVLDGPPEPFVLSLTADGRTFFEDEPEVEAAALQDRLRRARHEAPSRGIRLKADQSLTVGTVRTVLESVRAAGAPRVYFAVEQPVRH